MWVGDMHLFSGRMSSITALKSRARKPGPSALAPAPATRHEATLLPLLAEPFGLLAAKDVHDVAVSRGGGEIHRRARRVPVADNVGVRAARDLSEPR